MLTPIAMLLFINLAYSDEPVGGERDPWWRPFVSESNERLGVDYFNSSEKKNKKRKKDHSHGIFSFHHHAHSHKH